jgi:small-conductance mechanosensitive channel
MQSGPLRVFALLAVMIFNFIDTYFAMLALWLLVFISLHLQVISDPYIYILFYLASIPYLLFLSRRFIRYCIQFNIRHDHIFLEADFQRRFAIVFSGLLYSTIIISFFREAFMLANYYRSELPTILLTVNFIIFQVSLILLISKEQILNLTPSRSDLWMSIRGIVNNYYYHIQLMIIAIIIMGNPYVGFGKLVLYILFGFIYTGFLIALLLWCHGLFKRVISRIFFVTDDEVIKERFANAKTWFGLLIITSFIVIGFIGVVMGAKIWGWPITVSDIVSLFDEPLLLKASAHPITVRSILQIIGFIFAGFILSYAISSFVLDKIFDLLLVDSGVQHTVTSITQYLVIIIAVFLGLQNVGLGELVGYFIAALTLSLGWVLREPISDFIAYFIILVQRPVKIGDYIKIDDHVMGVVRRITARAVILRKKNSNTIIVPNAMIISKPIMNWNYAHNFIAFNDIIIMIDYKEDAVKVKELLLAAVQSHPNILRSPQPIIRLESFSDYGYQFMIRGYISSVYTLEQWDIESDIRITIAKVLRDNSISVAIRPVGVTFLPTKEE